MGESEKRGGKLTDRSRDFADIERVGELIIYSWQGFWAWSGVWAVFCDGSGEGFLGVSWFGAA